MNMTNEPKLSPDDISELLRSVQQDREAKKVFLAMQREEQLLAILGMLAFFSSRLANMESSVIGMKGDFDLMQSESRNARRQREHIEQELASKLNIRFEKTDDDTMTTTDKVRAVISAQYGGIAKFFLDILKGALQTVFTMIVLAVMYLAFGGKLP